MADRDLLRRRIDALLDYLTRLERFKAVAREQFVAEPDTHHLAELIGIERAAHRSR